MNQEPVLSRAAVVALYTRLLEAWNRRDAAGFAAQFTADGSTVGFDGSQLDGRAAIATELGRIFADHTPATYVARVREVLPLGSGAVLLRAVAGMGAPNAAAGKPRLNAVQRLVAGGAGGGARTARVRQVVTCGVDGVGPSSCRLVGFDATVRVRVVVMSDSTAEVNVEVKRRSGSERVPIWTYEPTIEIQRRRGAWRLARVGRVRSS